MENILNDILRQKGIKKSWLTKQFGVSNQTITNWVKGYNYPDLKKLKKLSQILNIRIDKIFFVEDNNINDDNLNTDIDKSG